MNQIQIAEKLGIHKVHLNAVLKGRRIPSIKLALKIEEVTEGKVRAESLRPELKIIRDKIRATLAKQK